MRRCERAEKEISNWKSKFRLLKDWEIEFDTESEFKDQSSLNTVEEYGIIYDSSFERMPKDYIFHEVLHFACAVVRNKKGRAQREAEEIMVQDLCLIVYP